MFGYGFRVISLEPSWLQSPPSVGNSVYGWVEVGGEDLGGIPRIPKCGVKHDDDIYFAGSSLRDFLRSRKVMNDTDAKCQWATAG